MIIIIGVIFLLNIFVVEGYGEAEFVFASLKIITIIGLLFLAVILFFGGGVSFTQFYFPLHINLDNILTNNSPRMTGLASVTGNTPGL